MKDVNLVRLSEEIKEFEEYLAPTTFETRSRHDLFQTIRSIALQNYPEATVEPFGSFETQLLLPSSDIDLNISTDDGIKPQTILKKISKCLRQYGYMQPVFRATVPVIKFCEYKSALNADITAQNNVISSKRTLQWMEEYPELKPLFLVLKHALLGIRFEHDPNYEVLSTVRNGLASYALICLITHYLKYNGDTSEKDGKEDKDFSKKRLGMLLIGFLKFYSTFDFDTKGLTFYTSEGYFDRRDGAFDPKCLNGTIAIENPDDPSANVARATRTAKQFQAALGWMHVQLNTRIESDTFQRSLLEKVILVESHPSNTPRKNLTKYQFPLKYLSVEDLGASNLPSVDPYLFANNAARKRKQSYIDRDDGDNIGRSSNENSRPKKRKKEKRGQSHSQERGNGRRFKRSR
ncbi:hypothetical protein BDB00DRAFT_859845 [Zychaea mexicana]|uniref:uncharacterized protein n=1 Tax=Zychaea mexicana TaxID=64656 RepID=UPI0022FE28E5|nr:uncharacterized protein BDB00DRAFT_859845 [Zychaea mexicana]KAI9476611.1 hypothetical protein BDB00DRAFT_859845 [Zychaea mexicana]